MGEVTAGTIPDKSVEIPSIAAKLDQLGAAIAEAHEILDGITGPQASAEGQPTAPGAEAGLDRCQERTQELIARLRSVRGRVGQL